MSDSGSNILDRGLTPDQAREAIAQRDRLSWFPANHANGDRGIIAGRDGREVARCYTDTDQAAILTMARSHDAMRAVLERIKPVSRPEVGVAFTAFFSIEDCEALSSAIALARGVK